MFLQPTKGFSLIELLVAISILSTLAVTAVTILGPARIKSRDGIRKQDLHNIAQALEIYFQSNGRFPCSTGRIAVDKPGFIYVNPGGGNYSVSGGFWIADDFVREGARSSLVLCSGGKVFDSTYISAIPQDPSSNDLGFLEDPSKYGYYFWAGDTTSGDWAGCPPSAGQYFVLAARLENNTDPDRNEFKSYKSCSSNPSEIFPTSKDAYKGLYILTYDQ